MQIICREPEELLKLLIIAFNPYPANIFVLKIIGLDKPKFFERKIVNIFLPISFNICFGRSKELSY